MVEEPSGIARFQRECLTKGERILRVKVSSSSSVATGASPSLWQKTVQGLGGFLKVRSSYKKREAKEQQKGDTPFEELEQEIQKRRAALKKGFVWPKEKRGSKEFGDELERQGRARIFLPEAPTKEEQMMHNLPEKPVEHWMKHIIRKFP